MFTGFFNLAPSSHRAALASQKTREAGYLSGRLQHDDQFQG